MQLLDGLSAGARFLDRLVERLERFILAVSVIAMATINIANAIGRTIFNNSLTFAEEANQILLIFITFMGIGFAARIGRHIRMTAIYDQLSGTPRKTLQVLSTLGTAALLFTLAYFGWQFVVGQMDFGGSTPALGIPWYLINLVVPVGFFLGGLQFALAALRNLSTPGVHTSFTHEESYDEMQPPASL
ncbi:TRAP transporter small permease [Ectothiorhodospiraceae bacterium WFHF3C12]|nr:TRAP transporter small permease [Ectothiorhodospiraceae bacterium WFHF3C12]